MNAALMTFVIQVMLTGAFLIFSVLMLARLRGGDFVFSTRRRQWGGLLFCVGMCGWELWWMLRWSLMVIGQPDVSRMFVENVSLAFAFPAFSAAGLSLFSSELIRPVFRRLALPVAALIILCPLLAVMVVGI